MTPDEIFAETGYKVLQVKFDKESKVIRQLFYKQHLVKEPSAEKPVDRTLFVINIPPYCSKKCMKRLFECCGEVKDIYFHKTPTSTGPPKKSKFFPVEPPLKGYKVAYLVFQEPGHLKAALDMNWSAPQILYSDGHSALIGMKKWCKNYERSINMSVEDMQAEIDSYMAEYDEKLRLEKEAAKQKKNKEGEDGWLEVTEFNNVIPRNEALIEKIKAKEEKKRSRKELQNFYTFQIRETRMKAVAELRKKFEDDKQRIALMKASKSFNPFAE